MGKGKQKRAASLQSRPGNIVRPTTMCPRLAHHRHSADQVPTLCNQSAYTLQPKYLHFGNRLPTTGLDGVRAPIPYRPCLVRLDTRSTAPTSDRRHLPRLPPGQKRQGEHRLLVFSRHFLSLSFPFYAQIFVSLWRLTKPKKYDTHTQNEQLVCSRLSETKGSGHSR